MRKLLLMLLIIVACFTESNAQILYKISGNGIERPSYIIGTYHLANVGFIDKIPGIHTALTETAQVYGEVVWSDMMNADTLKMAQQSMMLSDGKRLKDVLTADQYQKVNKCLKGMMGVDLNNTMVEAQMGSMLPVSLLNQLIVLQYMTKHMGEFDPTSTFDQYFQSHALKNKEPVRGLETVSYQTNLMFHSMDLSRQIAQLMCFVDHTEEMGKMNEDIVTAFYAQDLDGIKKALDAKMGNACDATPAEEEALINQRNTNWLALMPEVIKHTPTMFVVGAAHLTGDKGVLQGLRNQGFNVEGVK